MDVLRAQADVRRIYRGGFSGPLVSGIIWGAANAAFYWGSAAAGMAVLFVGGAFIFPLATLVLKLMGGPIALPKEPLLFFPASLIIVGAHYLVFISLYGMKLFALLAGALVALGIITMFFVPKLGDISGWLGAAILLAFAVQLFRASDASG